MNSNSIRDVIGIPPELCTLIADYAAHLPQFCIKIEPASKKLCCNEKIEAEIQKIIENQEFWKHPESYIGALRALIQPKTWAYGSALQGDNRLKDQAISFVFEQLLLK